MVEVLLRKRLGGTLEPIEDGGVEALRSFAVGTILKINVTKPRNGAHHALYWVLVDRIFQNQTYFKTPYQLHQAIKHATGYAKTLHRKDGTPYTVYESIRFGSMDQIKFNEFYSAVVTFVCEEVIPKLEEGALKTEIEALVA